MLEQPSPGTPDWVQTPNNFHAFSGRKPNLEGEIQNFCFRVLEHLILTTESPGTPEQYINKCKSLTNIFHFWTLGTLGTFDNFELKRKNIMFCIQVLEEA